MVGLLYSPPIVFLIFLVIFLASAKAFSLYAYSNAQRSTAWTPMPVGSACRHYINPDYSQFFPFAFLHDRMFCPGGRDRFLRSAAVANYLCGSGILAMVIIFRIEPPLVANVINVKR